MDVNNTKIMRFIGSFTNVAGETLTWTSGEVNFQGACFMDVLIDIKTLTGTSPTLKVAVQEQFNSLANVETAVTAANSSTGRYFLANGVTNTTQEANNLGSFSLLGKGLQKKFVSTLGGTVSAVTADVYVIIYNQN